MIVFDASAKENGPNLTFSWRRPSSMDWFLYDNGLRHERVKWGFAQRVKTNAFDFWYT